MPADLNREVRLPAGRFVSLRGEGLERILVVSEAGLVRDAEGVFPVRNKGGVGPEHGASESGAGDPADAVHGGTMPDTGAGVCQRCVNGGRLVAASSTWETETVPLSYAGGVDVPTRGYRLPRFRCNGRVGVTYSDVGLRRFRILRARISLISR